MRSLRLFAALASLAAALPAAQGAGPSLAVSPDEQALFDRLNQRRRAEGRPALAWDATSFETLRRIAGEPREHKLTCDEIAARVDARRGAKLSWTCNFITSGDAEAAAARVTGDPDFLSREYSHGSVVVVDVGDERRFVAAYACYVPPVAGRHNVNGPPGEYRFHCPACGRDTTYNLGAPHASLFDCPVCGTVESPWIDDMRHVLHWPTWFVQPYAPFDTGNPFLAWQWVNEKVRYDHPKADHDQPGWQTPEETDRLGTGVCRDTAVLLAAWLRHSGKDARVVSGLLDEDHHAWVILRDGETRYLLETAMDARMSRRYPPRLELATRYTPTRMMFDDTHVWLNRGHVRARDYDSPRIWLAAEEAP